MSSSEKAIWEARKVLRAEGVRATPQRGLVLKIIRESNGHLDADELYRRAKEEDPHISLSTVYRTLGLLKEVGLVEERYFDKDHHHYELKPAKEHHHLICAGCGEIVEFESPLMAELKAEVARQYGFQITHTNIDITGYCAKCRDRR
ncbi:MAG: Fur family transcriptional regulator [Anaerolineae bacterium]